MARSDREQSSKRAAVLAPGKAAAADDLLAWLSDELEGHIDHASREDDDAHYIDLTDVLMGGLGSTAPRRQTRAEKSRTPTPALATAAPAADMAEDLDGSPHGGQNRDCREPAAVEPTRPERAAGGVRVEIAGFDGRLGTKLTWPPMEGMRAEPRLPWDVEPGAIARAPAPETSAGGVAPGSDEAQTPDPAAEGTDPSWAETIEALRRENEELRAAHGLALAALSPNAAPLPPLPPTPAPTPGAPPVQAKTAKSGTRRSGREGVQDEWGFFNPDQCGLSALLARLDTQSDDDGDDAV